jgi:ribonuclease HII
MNLCSFGIENRINQDVIAGVDEVGRGCLAGPVVCAAVVFPRELRHSSCDEIKAIQDSKKLSAKQRGELKIFIERYALATAIAKVDPLEIDRINILQATFKAAREAVRLIQLKCASPLNFVLMDGNHVIPGLDVKQEAIIKGDQFSKSIAAASILAKVTRDQWMLDASKDFPQYGFEKHKGYGTELHCDAIQKFGPCELHRRSFLKKLTTKDKGQDGEELVVSYLLRNQFQIIDRNWKCKAGEIDIVAERAGEIHLIEVRSRSEFAEVAQLFPTAKQAKLRKLSEFYQLLNRSAQSAPVHVDLMAVCSGQVEPYWDVLQ